MKLSIFGEAITMNKAKLLGIAMALTVFGTSMNTVSAAEDTPINMTGDVFTWTETVDAVVTKNDDGTINVHCDTYESEEMYNYITVSSIFDGAYDPAVTVYNEEYKGIAIDIVNTSDVEVSIDFILVDKDNNKLVLMEDETVIVEKNNEKYLEQTEFASIKIEPQFQGKVYIPLDVMEQSSENSKDIDMTKLTSWSLGILLEKEAVADIKINAMSWISSDFIEQFGTSFGATIEGDDSVMLPEHGESIAFFEIVEENDSNYKFVLDGYSDGITLNETGKITLTTECVAQEVVLKAVDKNGVIITKKISLAPSWRVDSDEFGFNGPEDLEEVDYPFKNVTNEWIEVIRNILVAGIAIVLISYFVFYVKDKINKKREERR